MQTLKLIIPGSYYDDQIYSGRLHLWTSDGAIVTLDWDALINSMRVPGRHQLALVCAFRKSEYLYGDHWQLIFQDTEIKTAIQRKFAQLAQTTLEVSNDELSTFVVRKQDNPFPFPHADCTIYRNTLYVGSQSGVFAATSDRKSKTPINRKPNKIWDGPSLGVAASYLTLAISAGSEGSFEYSLEDDDSWSMNRRPHRLMTEHSNSIRWLFASIFSSSYLNEGYLADYVTEMEQEGGDDEKRRKRVLRNVVPSSEIFGHPTQNGVASYTWGVHDKICFATPKSVEVVQYSPYKDSSEERFTRLGEVDTNSLQGEIVNGDSASFGFIVESEGGLLVINSLMESMWLEGEPVNWRVFPKSKFYTNQLHVIYHDHLCIYSFNQDYFVDQKTKRVGIRHPREFRLGGIGGS